MQKTILSKLKRLFKRPKKFESQNYWNDRYNAGGNSGSGSYNNLANFKADFLNEFVLNNNIQEIIEFGCGDGNQLSLFNFPSYLGFDVSEKAVKICSDKFKNDKTKNFELIKPKLVPKSKAKLSLSLDVIYHLIEDHVFEEHLQNLFNSSENFVIIYSTNFDEPIKQHERNREFTFWIDKNLPHWALIDTVLNKYPYNSEDSDSTSDANFYVYKKLK